jgi:drug/metabolite transporter (DMT)-like permease
MQIRGLTFTGAALVTAYAGAEGNGGGAAGGGANGASMLGQLALIGYAFFFSLQRVRTLASSLMFNAYTVISAANAQPFTALQMPFAALWSLLLIKEPISISAIAGGSLMLVATLLACTDKKTGAK